MYFLYLDESGSNTSHFVLLGLAIPATSWFEKSAQITKIKSQFNLRGKEIHSGWMMRRYLEQERIQDFESRDFASRKSEFEIEHNKTLNRLALLGNRKKIKNAKKVLKKQKIMFI